MADMLEPKLKVCDILRYAYTGWFMVTSGTLLDVVKSLPELVEQWPDRMRFMMDTFNGDSKNGDGKKEEPPEKATV